jgi:hypothetical protein
MTWVACWGEGIDAYSRSRLVDMVHGTAYRPYVYRALVPATARLGASLTPLTIRSSLTALFRAQKQKPSDWDAQFAAEYVWVISIMALSLLGFAAATRTLFQAVFVASASYASPTALVLLAIVPIFFGPFSRQIYDFTTLWLFTLGLGFIASRRWRAYAALFPLACLNKETAVLLTLVFIASARNRQRADGDDRVTLRSLLAYQTIVFVAIRSAVAYVFRDNPGSAVELHLFDHNAQVLLHPGSMSKRLIVLLGAGVIGAYGWERKPPFLRLALLTLAPALLVMGMTVGQVDEIRAYYEIYPVIGLLVADTCFQAFERPFLSKPVVAPAALSPSATRLRR